MRSRKFPSGDRPRRRTLTLREPPSKEAHERCAVGPAARATGPVDSLYLRGRWRRHCADLREERHQIEVMLCLSDLVAFERHDLDRWDLHALVGGRDRPHLALELTVVRALPGDLENDSVATLNGLGDRPLGVGECLTPAFAELDDRVRPLDPSLGRELGVNGILTERGLEARPVTFAESFDVLLRQLNFVCHRLPPLSLVR